MVAMRTSLVVAVAVALCVPCARADYEYGGCRALMAVASPKWCFDVSDRVDRSLPLDANRCL